MNNSAATTESLTPTTPGFLEGLMAPIPNRAARRKATLEDLRTPDMNRTETPGTKMLLAMRATGRPFYQGTVDPVEVARRRAANKAARKARRAARR